MKKHTTSTAIPTYALLVGGTLRSPFIFPPRGARCPRFAAKRALSAREPQGNEQPRSGYAASVPGRPIRGTHSPQLQRSDRRENPRSELHRDRVGALETNASNIPGKPIGFSVMAAWRRRVGLEESVSQVRAKSPVANLPQARLPPRSGAVPLSVEILEAVVAR